MSYLEFISQLLGGQGQWGSGKKQSEQRGVAMGGRAGVQQLGARGREREAVVSWRSPAQ